jgi:hypothetical protein
MDCPFCAAARELVDAERDVIDARALLARRLLELLPVWESAIKLQVEVLDNLRQSLAQLATTSDDVPRGRVQ